MTNPSPQDVERMIERLKRGADRAESSPSISLPFLMHSAADMLAALSAIRLDEEGWQPIETAPRDKWLLLAEAPYEPGPYDAYAGHWHSDGYWLSNCGQYVTETPEPTHWRPLPQPPRLSLEGGDDASPAA